MKRALAASIVLAAVAIASAAGATPAPKYLHVNGGGNPLHWFKTGSGNSDTPPSSMTLLVHWDSSPSNNMSNALAVQAVKDAFAQWTTMACTTLDVDMTEAPSATHHTGFANDNHIVISFNDPAGDLGGLTLAATTTPYNNSGASDQESVNGFTWNRISDFDIVFANGWSWVNRQQNDAGQCNNQSDIQSVAVHELGHGIGYAHSCESGEDCQDGDLQTSIMYWQEGPCQELAANEWDLQEQSIAYGIGASSDFTADAQSGGVPLSVNFTPVAITSSSILSAAWTFGDGDTSSATAPNHVYSTQGIYNVQVDLSANSPACGGNYEQTVRKNSFIKACDPIEAAFHFDHSGKTFHFHSDTQGSVTGCLSSLDWDFGDGTPHANTSAPTHSYAAGGTYDVTLTATGAAGIAAPLTQTVSTASKKAGCSCSLENAPGGEAGTTSSSIAIALGLVGVTLGRRRRVDSRL